MSNIVLVTNIPTPYRLPLFDAISKGLEPHGHRLFVLFGSETANGRHWHIDLSRRGFAFDFTGGPALNLPGTDEPTFTYWGLVGHVERLDPALVITNGFGPSTLMMWLHSFANSHPFVIWSGATGDGPGWLARVRRYQRRLMLRRAEGCIAYGSTAKRYLIDIGESEESIRVALNTVDTAFFTRPRSLGVDRPFTFVVVGDLTGRKRIDLILAAANTLHRRSADFRVEIIGDGPTRGALEATSRELELDDVVTFRGFLQQSQIRDALAHSDCLLFASEFDIWGLVLNEAMAMALPVIASVRAGATIDLVVDGCTGFAVDFEDTPVVADRMDWLIHHRAEALAMGARAREFLLSNASLEVSAAAWVDAICTFALSANGHRSESR